MSSPSEFKFLGYRVSRINFELKDDFYSHPIGNFNQAIEIQQNFSQDNERFVEIILNIKITNEKETFNFTLSIKGGFEAIKEMPEELFKSLYTVNAPAILYPFARAIITTYTAQANIPPVILPAVNFMPNSKEKTKE